MDWIGTCSGSSWGYWMAAVQTMPRAFDITEGRPAATTSTQPSNVLKGEPKLETSPQQKVTYEIADNAVWNDNVPITSTDFKYTWDQIANGDDVYDKTGYTNIAVGRRLEPEGRGRDLQQALRRLEGPLHRQLRHLPEPHPARARTATPTMKDGYTFSGGPWIIQQWVKTDNITLVPNPNYWGTKPSLDKVIFKFQPDTSSEFTAFKSDQVSMIYPQPQLDAVDQINAGLPNTPEGHHDRHRQLRGAVAQPGQAAVRRPDRPQGGGLLDRPAGDRAAPVRWHRRERPAAVPQRADRERSTSTRTPSRSTRRTCRRSTSCSRATATPRAATASTPRTARSSASPSAPRPGTSAVSSPSRSSSHS